MSYARSRGEEGDLTLTSDHDQFAIGEELKTGNDGRTARRDVQFLEDLAIAVVEKEDRALLGADCQDRERRCDGACMIAGAADEPHHLLPHLLTQGSRLEDEVPDLLVVRTTY